VSHITSLGSQECVIEQGSSPLAAQSEMWNNLLVTLEACSAEGFFHNIVLQIIRMIFEVTHQFICSRELENTFLGITNNHHCNIAAKLVKKVFQAEIATSKL
jgi:hypothetical protein